MEQPTAQAPAAAEKPIAKAPTAAEKLAAEVAQLPTSGLSPDEMRHKALTLLADAMDAKIAAIPPALLTHAGVKQGAKVKDVRQEIQRLEAVVPPELAAAVTELPRSNLSPLEMKRKALTLLAAALEAIDGIPDALWGYAGVKKGSKLKDVQTEIQKLKKSVSVQRKEKESDDEEQEEEGPAGDKQRQDMRVKKDVRRLGADKKAHVAAVMGGQYDMQRDYV